MTKLPIHLLLVDVTKNARFRNVILETIACAEDLKVVSVQEAKEHLCFLNYQVVILNEASNQDLLSMANLIKRDNPDIKVIFANDSPEWQQMRNAFRVGASDYISTSISSDELNLILQESLSS